MPLVFIFFKEWGLYTGAGQGVGEPEAHTILGSFLEKEYTIMNT